MSPHFSASRRAAWLLAVAAVVCLSCSEVAPAAATRRVEVKRHLKKLNKQFVKSIKSPDGDIIDCVHISKQPAFDHPLLKNHTIQMRPAFHPEGMLFDESKLASKQTLPSQSQLWHKNGRCPKNTIPIRRTKKDDMLRAISVENYGRKQHRSTSNPLSVEPDLLNENGHQHAIAYVEGDTYYGAKATINVWEPRIAQGNEFSLSQVWILGGSFGEDLNSIEAGWQVSPDLYGDGNTRLFTYWTDPTEGHWWMQFGNGHVLGYWPSFLFSYLAEGASMIEWGGEVVNSEAGGEHTSTAMGSGHFPGEGFRKSSYIRNIQVVDGSNTLRNPTGVATFTEQPNCYDVQVGNGGHWGHYFYYGGPGRNSECP